MRTSLVIPAAGQGNRLGASLPKAFAPLHDHPLLWWALRSVAESGIVDRVCIVAPQDYLAQCERLARTWADRLPVLVTCGGASRQASVAAGLAALGPGEREWVLVHDAARALTPPAVFQRVRQSLADGALAVTTALPVVDTIKEAAATSGRLTVARTLDRSRLWRVQTPQGFRADILKAVHRDYSDRAEREDLAATDDAGMVEAAGIEVEIVPGDELAFKVTTALDLQLAHALVRR